MAGSLLFHPNLAGPLWSRLLWGAAQPPRRSFKLERLRDDHGRAGGRTARRVIWSEKSLSLFATLSHARLEDGRARRRILLVPPMSGGFPFMMRDVAATLLPHAQIYVLEWLNARHLPARLGRFGVDDQVETIRRALRVMAGGHAVALCQSGAPTLLAAALEASVRPEQALRSLAIIGSPVDPARAPSVMSDAIQARDRAWYEAQLVRRRPAGARAEEARLVYPAEAQQRLLTATLLAQSPKKDEFARLMLKDDGDDPRAVSFSDISSAYMDLPAEHFMENLERVYLNSNGPCLALRWRGRAVDARALEHTAIMAVEGAEDRVAAPGQTQTALSLFPAAEPAGGDMMRRRVVAQGVGHFGLFYGRAWRTEVAPHLVRMFEDVEARDAARRASLQDAAEPALEGAVRERRAPSARPQQPMAAIPAEAPAAS